MVIERHIGDVKELKLYFEGSGNPSEAHKIIGIAYLNKEGNKWTVGETDKIQNTDKRE